MAYKTGSFKVPFNPNNGEPLEDCTAGQTCGSYQPGPNGTWTYAQWTPVWRDNWEFDDVLTYQSTRKGRSSVNVTFKSQHLNCSVIMPLMFFTEAMVKAGIEPGGVLRGRFTFAKHVNHYVIKLI